MHVVVAGVSGAGKSTVGRLLAERLGASYVEGDDLHPAANRHKMAAGRPLTDADREPWLDAVATTLTAEEPVVVACSALKRIYRDRLRATAPDLFLVLLDGDPEQIRERQSNRTEHFMPPSLMASQLATLEPLEDDERGIRLDVAATPPALVDAAMRALGR